jgi:hypothetical protein
MLLEDRELQERVARMETLLGEIEALKDPHARSKAAEVVGFLLDLYGDNLARMMEVVAEGEDRERAFEVFAGDELVSHLLLLHGLHPLDLESRATRPRRQAPPLPVHQLHQLRSAIYHNEINPLRPVYDYDVRVRDVPRMPE